jgi:Flp pilus assembly protein TadG
MRSFFGSFSCCRRGNISVVLALAMVPLALIVGAAIDYTRAAGVRVAMQDALDAATLAATKDAAGQSAAELQTSVNEKFTAMLNRPDLDGVQVTSQFVNGALSTTAAGSIATSFMALGGVMNLDVGVSSQSSISSGRLEVVLALDNTGSMAGSGKIQALISSAHQFVTALQNSPGAGSVKVSIVPFDTHVNVGKANNAASWIDWTNYEPPNNYGAGPDTQGGTSGNGADYGTSCPDVNPDPDHDDDHWRHHHHWDGWHWNWQDDNCRGTAGHPTWTGCVIDRAHPYDVRNTIPTSDSSTWYPAVDCTLAPLLPLGNDWTALHAEIDLMHASGNTDLPIGLAWAWNMVTQNGTLSAAAAPAPDLEKYIVFLTDGVNTQDRFTTNSSQIDARTRQICDNIKATGVKIFTIRVIDGNASLLQSCASDPSMYYEVSQAAQLAQVFQQVAQNFNRLRLMR